MIFSLLFVIINIKTNSPNTFKLIFFYKYQGKTMVLRQWQLKTYEWRKNHGNALKFMLAPLWKTLGKWGVNSLGKLLLSA
jgi:hypothetical protein